jgi:hypothetical protein
MASGRRSEPVAATIRIRPRDRAADKEDTGLTDVASLLTARAADVCAVIPPSGGQLQVYARCGAPLLEALFGGYDACLFAYGQTGSGKTHSMLGAHGGRRGGVLDGVVPATSSEVCG